MTAHVVGDRIFAMLEAFTSGRNAEAARLHRSMLPVNVGLFRNQAAVLTKAAMDLLGLPGGGVRGPLLPASDAERQHAPRGPDRGRRQAARDANGDAL